MKGSKLLVLLNSLSEEDLELPIAVKDLIRNKEIAGLILKEDSTVTESGKICCRSLLIETS